MIILLVLGLLLRVIYRELKEQFGTFIGIVIFIAIIVLVCLICLR